MTNRQLQSQQQYTASIRGNSFIPLYHYIW